MSGWCTHWSKKTCAPTAAKPIGSLSFSARGLAANPTVPGNMRPKMGT